MTLSTHLLFVAAMAGAGLGAEPATIPAGGPELTVRLYDYTDMGQGTFERTRRQADEILTRAGLRIDWQVCPTSEEQAKVNRECARRADVRTIQMRILSKDMAKKMTKRGIEFGYEVALYDASGRTLWPLGSAVSGPRGDR